MYLNELKYINFNKWMDDHATALAAYYIKSTGHVTLDFSRAMDNLSSKIKDGDDLAFALGFDLLIFDPMMPFGKIVKSKLIKSIAKEYQRIDEEKLLMLISLRRKWGLMRPYPPREFRYLNNFLNKYDKLNHEIKIV